MSAFTRNLPTQGTIGKLETTIVGGDPVTQWVTYYECQADIQTLRASEQFHGDAPRVEATHRIFTPPHDLNQNPMVLDETMEFVETIPFDYETQKHLTRYRFVLVDDQLGGHHIEILAKRVAPGG